MCRSKKDIIRSRSVVARLLLRDQIKGTDQALVPVRETELLSICGVAISVAIDLVIVRRGRTERMCGAVSVLPRTAHGPDSDSERHKLCQYLCLLLYQSLKAKSREGLRAERSLCWAIDAQACQLHQARLSYRKQGHSIEKACLMLRDRVKL